MNKLDNLAAHALFFRAQATSFVLRKLFTDEQHDLSLTTRLVPVTPSSLLAYPIHATSDSTGVPNIWNTHQRANGSIPQPQAPRALTGSSDGTSHISHRQFKIAGAQSKLVLMTGTELLRIHRPQ